MKRGFSVSMAQRFLPCNRSAMPDPGKTRVTLAHGQGPDLEIHKAEAIEHYTPRQLAANRWPSMN